MVIVEFIGVFSKFQFVSSLIIFCSQTWAVRDEETRARSLSGVNLCEAEEITIVISQRPDMRISMTGTDHLTKIDMRDLIIAKQAWNERSDFYQKKSQDLYRNVHTDQEVLITHGVLPEGTRGVLTDTRGVRDKTRGVLTDTRE